MCHTRCTCTLRHGCRLCAAGQTPAVLTLANWTLQQPLAAKPGQRYSYTNDAFWLLTYIVEKARLGPLWCCWRASLLCCW